MPCCRAVAKVKARHKTTRWGWPSMAAQLVAHDKHAGHSVAMFRDRFWLSLALTLPTLVWGTCSRESSATRRPRCRGHT